MAIFDELGCFKSVRGHVARQIELQKETLEGYDVERAVVGDQNKILLVVALRLIELKALVNEVRDIDHGLLSVDFWENFPLVHL